MKKVLIRSDASPQVGAGHLMRSVALAQCFQTQGIQVLFMTIPAIFEALNQYLKSQAFPVKLMDLPSDHAGSERDLQTVLEEVRQGYDWVVLDNYYFSLDYQKEIQRAGCSLAVIDDRREIQSCADILVNLAVTEQNCLQCKGVRETLVGPRYVPIRDELLRLTKGDRGSLKNVLVTLGGSRQTETLSKIVRALKIVKGQRFDVKVLGGFEHAPFDEGALPQGIEFHDGSIHNYKFYEWADLAIAAAGGTVWELCYFGIPAVIGALSANQAVFGEALGRLGICEYVGEYSRTEEGEIAGIIENLLRHPDRISSLRNQSKGLIDGKGAERIIEAMKISVIEKSKAGVRADA